MFRTSWLMAAAAVLVAAPAMADEGLYAASLKAMLTQTAAGNCPADIMAADLLAACRQQIGAMRPALEAAGPVTVMTFVGSEGEGAARVETYKVSFAKGSTATWHIGRRRDGRFESAYWKGD